MTDTLKDRIAKIHAEFPELDTQEVALRLGVPTSRVSWSSKHYNLGVPLIKPEKRKMQRRAAIAKTQAIQREQRAEAKKAGVVKVLTPRAGTVTEKIVNLVRSTPGITRQQVLDQTGVENTILNYINYRYKLKLAHDGAHKEKVIDNRPRSNIKDTTVTPVDKPMVAKTIENRPAPMPRTIRSATPRANGKVKYMLVDPDTGLFLHMSCTSMTSKTSEAWQDGEQRMEACKNRYDLAKNLVPRRVFESSSYVNPRGR